MKLKLVENEYFNKGTPLIKQLYKYKKKCYHPGYNIAQLIKFKCQYCNIPNCEFRPAIKSKLFINTYNFILKDKKIKVPEVISTKTNKFERFCSNKYSLPELLTLEQKKFENENYKKYPCDTCKYKKVCPIKINDNLRNLILFDIESIDDNGDIKWLKDNNMEKDINGISKSSYYYKHYIDNNKIISKSAKYYKKSDTFEKKFKKYNSTNNDKIYKIPNIHIYLLMKMYNKGNKFDENFKFYIHIKKIQHRLNTNNIKIKEIDKIYRDKIKQFTKFKILTENSQNRIKFNNKFEFKTYNIIINVNKLKIYRKITNLTYKHIFYELMLTRNPYISRNKINEIWNITLKTQLEWEKKLNIYKKNNMFRTHESIINIIFKNESLKQNLKKNEEILKKLKNC